MVRCNSMPEPNFSTKRYRPQKKAWWEILLNYPTQISRPLVNFLGNLLGWVFWLMLDERAKSLQSELTCFCVFKAMWLSWVVRRKACFKMFREMELSKPLAYPTWLITTVAVVLLASGEGELVAQTWLHCMTERDISFRESEVSNRHLGDCWELMPHGTSDWLRKSRNCKNHVLMNSLKARMIDSLYDFHT